jgi:CelD/BcsL family acetyltransferase involved in cellulose biosynthesis
MKIVKSVSAMASMEKEWNVLADRFRKPFLSHEWFLSCAKTFHKNDELHVIVVESGGETAGIAPLVSVRQRGFRRLEALGVFHIFEPGGFLYADEKALEELVSAVVSSKRFARLGRIQEGSAEHSLVTGGAMNRAWALHSRAKGTPWIQIDKDWGAYCSGLSSKRRYDLRRATKRAEGEGALSIEILSPGLDTYERYVNLFVEVEANSWKGESGTAAKYDGAMREFLFDYCASMAGKNCLRIGLLTINDLPVSAVLAVERYNRLWIHKIGYDRNFAHCSPGVLLTHETVRYAFDRRLEGYEFLGTDEAWIGMWTDRKHEYEDVRICPKTLAGYAYWALRGAKRFVEKHRGRNPGTTA